MTSPVRFTDYPSIEYREDYEPARKHLYQQASGISGVLGLYEYGSVGTPGISDIDLIAVISKRIDKQEMLEFLSGTGAPAYVLRVLDQGTVKPMNENLFERLQVLGEISTNPIYAPDPITPTTPDRSSLIFIDAANVIDWLPERILMLRSLLSRPTLSCRRVLGGLGSFKHSATTVSRVLGYVPEPTIAFSNAYDALRTDWFNQIESVNFETTLSLIEQGIATGTQLITLVTERLLEMNILTPNDSAAGSIFWLNSSKAFVFGKQINNQTPLENNPQRQIQNIPPSWFSAFATYASTPGEISSLISSNLEPRTGYSHHTTHNEFDRILIERIEWINESFKFLNPLGLVKLMYRFSHLQRH